jgi:hypothetical protein
MSELRNHRHELMAKHLAAGKTATESYSLAGYQPCRQNASRLASNDDIQRRVEELKQRPETNTKADRDPETGRFLTGNTGGGRPKGSRNLLSERFISDLCNEWEKSGVVALQRASEKDPVALIKVVASLVPAKLDASLNVEFSAAESFIQAFRLARRQVADADDPLLPDLQAEPDAAER